MKEICTLIRESLQVKYYYIFILSSQLYLQYGVIIFLEKNCAYAATEDKTDDAPCTMYLHLPKRRR